MLAERSAAQGDDEEYRAPDLQEQVASDEQLRTSIERGVDREGHEQAGKHQPDERHAHCEPIRLEPVRSPCGHVPGVEDRKFQDHGFGARPQIWTGFANTEEDCADAYIGKTTMLTGSGTGVVSHKRIGRLAASWRGTLQA